MSEIERYPMHSIPNTCWKSDVSVRKQTMVSEVRRKPPRCDDRDFQKGEKTSVLNRAEASEIEGRASQIGQNNLMVAPVDN